MGLPRQTVHSALEVGGIQVVKAKSCKHHRQRNLPLKRSASSHDCGPCLGALSVEGSYRQQVRACYRERIEGFRQALNKRAVRLTYLLHLKSGAVGATPTDVSVAWQNLWCIVRFRIRLWAKDTWIPNLHPTLLPFQLKQPG